MNVPEPIRFDPRAADLRQEIDMLPAVSGIYLLRPAVGSPHLASTTNLRRRMNRLFSPGARFHETVGAVDCWVTSSKLEKLLLMHALAKHHHPDDYLFRLKLRIPWFVGLTANDPFTRVVVVNRVSRNSALLLGPFPSRSAAQLYEQQVSGLFQVRRCTERLHPSPDHPGCVYGEMNQCLRPCQCAVTREEYASEAQRVSDFLLTNGRTSLATLTSARDRAAEQTEFEQAAHIHRQVEKVRAAVAARDDVVGNVYHFNGVALTCGRKPGEFRLWPMLSGYWQPGLRFEIAHDESQPKSMDRQLRELLSEGLQRPALEGKRAEDLAIFARWYYSSWCDGEWFAFRKIEDLNYRKLVKQISTLAKKAVV